MVRKVFTHFRYKLFLYVYELLSSIVGRGCCELLLKILGVVLVISISDVYGHFQLYLIGVSAIGNTFVELVEAYDFAFQDKVAITFYLLQPCLAGIDVGEFVLENSLHGRPYVGAADGEVSYLYALYLGVVYAGAVELVADGARRA